MPDKLTFEKLKSAVSGSAAAFRCRSRLQPAGGEGDKVFPPTYAGAVYAVEKRKIPERDEPVQCVLLDSVQSQANRMEEALQIAVESGDLAIPLIQVDFSDYAPTGNEEEDRENGKFRDDLGKITSLQVPHRLADAILRDSEVEENDGGQTKPVPFRYSKIGKGINTASLRNATPIFRLCPTALLFGMWDSTGPKGGLGAKFERAMVSEVVGINASFGIKTASRIDPIITNTGAKTRNIVLYQSKEEGRIWTRDKAKAKEKNKQPVKLGKEGKVSEANLGNVTPSFHEYGKGAKGYDPLHEGSLELDYSIRANADVFRIQNRSHADSRQARQGQIAPGGVTVKYAEQLTTLSLIALRRLSFPVNGTASPEANQAGRTVLAALGLCAATLAFGSGMGLRSRCSLWPETAREWELLDRPGEDPQRFSLDRSSALRLFADAVEDCEENGLTWEKKPLTLKPSDDLVQLVRESQELAVKKGAEEE